MKKQFIALVLLFALALPFALVGCQSDTVQTDAPETDAPVTDAPETKAPETDPPETDAPETDAPETDAPETENPEFMEVRRAADEIKVYPFNAGELSAALKVVEEKMDDFKNGTGVLTFDVERIAFDPIMTDVRCRCIISDAPIEGWTEADYYERYICFTVTYSATYDHYKTFEQDTEHYGISVKLYREDAQSEWTYSDHGVPIEEHSQEALSADEVKQLTCDYGRILAAYEVSEEEYWLYVCDNETGEVRFVKQSR